MQNAHCSSTFAEFDHGSLSLPGRTVDFSTLAWNPHPAFPGVALKHIVTAADCDGRFSYHLVRIEPGKAILDHVHDMQLETHEVVHGTGSCVNNGIQLSYRPGVVTILERGARHEVHAGEDGLLLFAKFIPALC